MSKNQAEIQAGRLVVFFVDEYHLLGDDVCGYVWGPTDTRVEIPVKNIKDRQTYYGALDAQSQEFISREYSQGNGESTVEITCPLGNSISSCLTLHHWLSITIFDFKIFQELKFFILLKKQLSAIIAKLVDRLVVSDLFKANNHLLKTIVQISFQTFTANKRFPLTISRGTTAKTTNVWVRVEQDGIEGWGEASPFSIGEGRQSTSDILEALQKVAPSLEAIAASERQQIEHLLIEKQVPSAARAGVDVALHDWFGKRSKLPLWNAWGLNRSRIVPTSVTIGISSPKDARQRVRDWLKFTNVEILKVKLGNPAGIEADRAMLLAVRSEAQQALSVDANGGWSLDDAAIMCDWLFELGVKYVEQPLARGEEESLHLLYKRSPLPIFVDESCFTSQDIPKLRDRVHGINIKLMKCGGLTEAIRMVHTARACGLQVMLGCYSDSGLANTAAAQLSPLADYLDLDSHLNLIDDPFTGAIVQEGRLMPNDLPGLGVTKSQK